MNTVQEIKFYAGSKEEQLPQFSEDFPYIVSRAELDKYIGQMVPWHWHKAVELFYMESGTLEYRTSKEKIIFPAGSGGFVNSNVLHMTKTVSHAEENIQFLHIFDPYIISGTQGNKIEKKYVMPIITNPQIEIVGFYPENPEQAEILRLIKKAFDLSNSEMGYEIKVREALSKIWLRVFETVYSPFEGDRRQDKNDERLKIMLIYIHEHFSEKIIISELASAAYVSERACFRLFQTYLHMTPTEYINQYRLQEACRMLIGGKGTVTEIGQACGLGDSSYFGRRFRKFAQCSPKEYQKKWQNRNT